MYGVRNLVHRCSGIMRDCDIFLSWDISCWWQQCPHRLSGAHPWPPSFARLSVVAPLAPTSKLDAQKRASPPSSVIPHTQGDSTMNTRVESVCAYNIYILYLFINPEEGESLQTDIFFNLIPKNKCF